MKTKINLKLVKTTLRYSSGMALLDILLAIVIFVIGMLALAHLQGNLSRSAGDANARTVAANIAEEFVEALRTYSSVELATGDSCPTTLAALKTKKVFECVNTVGSSETIARGGVNYTVNLAVTDWYFKKDRQSLTSDKTDSDLSGRDLSISDFKEMQVSVAWTVVDFRVDDDVASDLGSGSFVATSVLPSIPVLGAAKIAADDDGAMGTPPVVYTPGQRPDIVAIQLDQSKFKESTTPLPEVIVRDEIVETWFDVITYNQATDDDGNPLSTYLRREEFAVVSCECTLRGPSGGEGDGFLPTTWNGTGYTEGAWVAKNYGESALNQQSQYCDTCCRDHHDSPSTGKDLIYRPFGSANHKHWGRGKKGGFVEATKDGDTYVEACRMVRKDGFMRVAQDFRQEQMYATPQSYFASTSNVTDYSTYVTEGVASTYPSGSAMPAPKDGDLQGDSSSNPITLPTPSLATSDQQVSRAVYIDHITAEAKLVIDCIKSNKSGDDCGAPGVSAGKWLEVFPFYEIQTTWLSWWQQTDSMVPVDVSSDPIADNNSHSRGMATRTGLTPGAGTIDVDMHTGNVGLTSTDPISPPEVHDPNVVVYQEHVSANGGGTPPAATTWSFSGSITSFANKPRAADVVFSGNGVNCSKNATDFTCAIDMDAVSATLVVSNYENKSLPYWVCMTGENVFPGTPVIQTAGPNSMTFDLSTVSSDLTGITLNIQDSSCSTPL